MKNNSSKKQLHTGTELKHYLGALHEEHMAGLKAMSERFIDMNRRFNGIDQKLDSHTEMIGKLAEDMVVVKSDLDTVKSDIEVIKSDVGVIKTDLKQKVDRSEFAVLERRVLRLESKVR